MAATQLDRIRVAVRVRPSGRPTNANGSISSSQSPCISAATVNTIEITEPLPIELNAVLGGAASALASSFKPHRRVFAFDRVYVDASQSALYADIGRPLLDSAFDGFNACVFAFGQTGSGKTHTMLGSSIPHLDGNTNCNGILQPGTSDYGLIPRLCADLFARIDALKWEQQQALQQQEMENTENDTKSTTPQVVTITEVTVSATFLEIYCESVRDLFALDRLSMSSSVENKRTNGKNISVANVRQTSPPTSTPFSASSPPSASSSSSHLRVREHPTKGTYVEGLTEVPLTCFADAEALLVAGSALRAVGETRGNAVSSRSHAVFTLCLTQRVVDAATGLPVNERISRITCVDLAGSERHDGNIVLPSNESHITSVPREALSPLTAKLNKQDGNVATQPRLKSKAAKVTFRSPAMEASAVAAASQQRQRESSKINVSLSALGAVIKALSSSPTPSSATSSSTTATIASAKNTTTSPQRFVPYRNSILTWLLRDCIGGNARTLMIATVSPIPTAYQETLSTLRYAESVKRVTQRASANDGLRPDDAAVVIEALRREVAWLRGQLRTVATTQSSSSAAMGTATAAATLSNVPPSATPKGVMSTLTADEAMDENNSSLMETNHTSIDINTTASLTPASRLMRRYRRQGNTQVDGMKNSSSSTSISNGRVGESRRLGLFSKPAFFSPDSLASTGSSHGRQSALRHQESNLHNELHLEANMIENDNAQLSTTMAMAIELDDVDDATGIATPRSSPQKSIHASADVNDENHNVSFVITPSASLRRNTRLTPASALGVESEYPSLPPGLEPHDIREKTTTTVAFPAVRSAGIPTQPTDWNTMATSETDGTQTNGIVAVVQAALSAAGIRVQLPPHAESHLQETSHSVNDTTFTSPRNQQRLASSLTKTATSALPAHHRVRFSAHPIILTPAKRFAEIVNSDASKTPKATNFTVSTPVAAAAAASVAALTTEHTYFAPDELEAALRHRTALLTHLLQTQSSTTTVYDHHHSKGHDQRPPQENSRQPDVIFSTALQPFGSPAMQRRLSARKLQHADTIARSMMQENNATQLNIPNGSEMISSSSFGGTTHQSKTITDTKHMNERTGRNLAAVVPRLNITQAMNESTISSKETSNTNIDHGKHQQVDTVSSPISNDAVNVHEIQPQQMSNATVGTTPQSLQTWLAQTNEPVSVVRTESTPTLVSATTMTTELPKQVTAVGVQTAAMQEPNDSAMNTTPQFVRRMRKELDEAHAAVRLLAKATSQPRQVVHTATSPVPTQIKKESVEKAKVPTVNTIDSSVQTSPDKKVKDITTNDISTMEQKTLSKHADRKTQVQVSSSDLKNMAENSKTSSKVTSTAISTTVPTLPTRFELDMNLASGAAHAHPPTDGTEEMRNKDESKFSLRTVPIEPAATNIRSMLQATKLDDVAVNTAAWHIQAKAAAVQAASVSTRNEVPISTSSTSSSSHHNSSLPSSTTPLSLPDARRLVALSARLIQALKARTNDALHMQDSVDEDRFHTAAAAARLGLTVARAALDEQVEAAAALLSEERSTPQLITTNMRSQSVSGTGPIHPTATSMTTTHENHHNDEDRVDFATAAMLRRLRVLGVHGTALRRAAKPRPTAVVE